MTAREQIVRAHERLDKAATFLRQLQTDVSEAHSRITSAGHAVAEVRATVTKVQHAIAGLKLAALTLHAHSIRIAFFETLDPRVAALEARLSALERRPGPDAPSRSEEVPYGDR